MQNRFRQVTGALFCATLLAACGGGDSPDQPQPGDNKFTRSATWTFNLPAAGMVTCYDFDEQSDVRDCAGNNWDLKIRSGSDGRSATLWTNSGISGPGRGGAFEGPFEPGWSILSGRNDAFIRDNRGIVMPPDLAYLKDAAYGVFNSNNIIAAAAYEYDVLGDHQLIPNYRVFLITTDSSDKDATGTENAPVFALQITGYYGGATGTAAGHPSFRWVDRTDPTVVYSDTVDASDETSWVHYDLIAGQVVSEADDWHIAFNRYNMKLNGGDSGPDNVAGFVGKTRADFYDGSGEPNLDAIIRATPADTLADLTADDIRVPSSARAWIVDTNNSLLNAPYRGIYPSVLDFGWYLYHPTANAAADAGLGATAHLLAANPEGAALLRSGEGDSFARFHVTDISYADPADYNSQQTWTIEFDIQPAQ